jgi:hypothetical protein
MTAAAMDLFYELAHDLQIQEPLGVSVFLGQEDDEGTFAVQPATWTGSRDRRVFALSKRKGEKRRQASLFTAEVMCDWQETGLSLLERRGEYLIGTLGTPAPPIQARPPSKGGKPRAAKG